MTEIEYCAELDYKIQTSCSDEQEGWDFLKHFVESSTTFFKLLGARIIFNEFWSYDEGKIIESNIVGYDISVVFHGKGSQITRFISATTLFFDLNDAVKTKEDLYFIPKNNHNL